MRIFLSALLLFAVIHFIRVDLTDGTIPLAAFFDRETSCVEEESTIHWIPVRTVEGDTIEALFALYPDPDSGFLERLAQFYTLNPHLENQALAAGEQIQLPMPAQEKKSCEK